MNINPSILNLEEQDELVQLLKDKGYPAMHRALLWFISWDTLQVVANDAGFRYSCDCGFCKALNKLGVKAYHDPR